MTDQPGPRRPLTRLLGAVRRHPIRTALLVGLGVVLAAGAAGYVVHRTLQAGDLWRQAQQAVADRDFERARECLQAYLAAQPDSGEAHLLMAQVCRRARAEDFDTAYEHLDAARRLGLPEKETEWEAHLHTYQASGNPQAGERHLLEYRDTGTGDERLVLEALARGCLHGDRVTTAASWLDAWVALDPDDWYPRLWRGAVYQHGGKPDLAVADYRRGLGARPQDARVKKCLGVVLAQSGLDYEQARQLLTDYLPDHPDDVDALTALARCRRALEGPDAARDALRQVVAANPQHYDALLALARVEMDREDDEEALKKLKRLEALAVRPDRREALRRLWRLDPVANNADGADRLNTVLQLTATALRRLGRTAEAEDYERRLEQHKADLAELARAMGESGKGPPDGDLFSRIGTLSMRVGRGEDGERWLQRALQENSDDRRAHQALADYYQARPDPDAQRLAEQHRRMAEGKE